MSETAFATRTRNGVDTVFQAYTGNTQSMVFLESKDLDLGDSDQDKYIDAVILDVTYPKGDDVPREIYVQLCFKDRMDDVEVWEDPARLFDEDHPVFDVRETARYVKLRLTDYFPVTIWQLGRIIFLGEFVGGRL
ncbi:MAG TPA: hypothetical protein VNS88_16390 [Nitrospiraceae bacterium]|nr:hypothetical protein [Nitrospiraceae bacterium]